MNDSMNSPIHNLFRGLKDLSLLPPEFLDDKSEISEVAAGGDSRVEKASKTENHSEMKVFLDDMTIFSEVSAGDEGNMEKASNTGITDHPEITVSNANEELEGDSLYKLSPEQMSDLVAEEFSLAEIVSRQAEIAYAGKKEKGKSIDALRLSSSFIVPPTSNSRIASIDASSILDSTSDSLLMASITAEHAEEKSKFLYAHQLTLGKEED